MIIFYNKITGEIAGTIEARIHTLEHMNMWIGAKDKNERLVIDWKAVKFRDEKGKVIKKANMVKGEFYNADFEPDHPQKDIFMKLDKKPSDVYKYKVDLKTKNLVKK